MSPTGRLIDMAAHQLARPGADDGQQGCRVPLIGTVGRSTFGRLGRGLPFVGGGVGAFDAYLLQRIADHAEGAPKARSVSRARLHREDRSRP